MRADVRRPTGLFVFDGMFPAHKVLRSVRFLWCCCRSFYRSARTLATHTWRRHRFLSLQLCCCALLLHSHRGASGFLSCPALLCALLRYLRVAPALRVLRYLRVSKCQAILVAASSKATKPKRQIRKETQVDNQATIRECTSFFLPSGGGRGLVPVSFRWCPAGERLVPSVRRCPPCLLSGGWFGVLFPAILSYASRLSNELASPFVVVLSEKQTKKAAKTMLVIHDESYQRR
jgi:hypothetical protein